MDNKKNLVVESNDLLEGSYHCGIDEMRLLHLAMMQINPSLVNTDDVFTIKASKFSEIFNIPLTHSYSKLKRACEKLLITTITTYSKEPNGAIRAHKFNWFEDVSYVIGGSEVEFVFHKHVRNHLFELKERFTQFNIEGVAALNLPFAVRLYTWLMKYRNLVNHKRDGGVFAEFSIDWIKERTGLTSSSYDNIKDFKRRVIDPAVKQINEKTDIYLAYKQLKTGRKTTSLEFFYIFEHRGIAQKDHIEPIRPRLPKRPHISKGSHEEGVWARKGIKLLTDYAEQLKLHNKVLEMSDMRRLIDYYKVVGDVLSVDKVQLEIDARKAKVARRYNASRRETAS